MLLFFASLKLENGKELIYCLCFLSLLILTKMLLCIESDNYLDDSELCT